MMWETAWESRSLPALFSGKKARREKSRRAFFFQAPGSGLRPCSFPRRPSAAAPPASRVAASSKKATMWETAWESRSLPALFSGKKSPTGEIASGFRFALRAAGFGHAVSHADHRRRRRPRAASRRAVKKPLCGKLHGRVGRCRHYSAEKSPTGEIASGFRFALRAAGFGHAVSHADHRRRSRPASRVAASSKKATMWETAWESRSMPGASRHALPRAHR